MEKSADMLNNKLSKLIHKFAVKGKYKLIGSNAKRGQLFTSDYDIATELTGRAETLANHFKRVMEDIPKRQYFFMDFKAGLDKRFIYDFNEDNLEQFLTNPLLPSSNKTEIRNATGEDRVKLIRDLFILRWTPSDIKRGYVLLVDGKKYTLEDALEDNTIIKLDFIVPIGDKFAEVSENYIYKQSESDNKQIVSDLADDIEKYKFQNTMKSLKRLYSILSLENPDDKRLPILELFFNSQYGLINKVANDMDLLLLLTEKHTIPFDKIMANIQLLKENLSLTSKISKFKILSLDKITKRTFRNRITKMITYLRNKINPEAKKLLKKIQ